MWPLRVYLARENFVYVQMLFAVTKNNRRLKIAHMFLKENHHKACKCKIVI